MSKFATKAAANMFCQARYEAAKSNERLSSREGAAEEIGIDRTRLARIELGSTIPYQEEVLLMFDTPDSCGECFCQKGYTVYGYACGLTNRMNKDARCRPGWCPLIPLPERHIASKTATGYEIGYEDGWNECLEKIVGGE